MPMRERPFSLPYVHVGGPIIAILQVELEIYDGTDACGARQWKLQRGRLSVLTLMVLGWCGDRPYSLVTRSLFRRVAEG